MSDDEAANIWGAARVGFDLSSNKFQDDETYQAGGLAWVSEVRRSSHARTEGALPPFQHPASEHRRASIGALGGPNQPLMMGSIYKNYHQQPINHFTGPSISLLDQFGGLGDATREASAKSNGENTASRLNGTDSATQGISDLSLESPKTSPLFSRRVVSSPFGKMPMHKLNGAMTSASGPIAGPAPIASMAHAPASPAPQLTPPTPTPAPAQLLHPGAQAGVQAGFQPTVPNPNTSISFHPSGSNGYASGSSRASSHLTGPSGPGSGNRKKWKRNKKYDNPILESLRSKSKPIQFTDTLGNVLEVSTDQYGSRFIQEHLAKTTPEVRDQFFKEASVHCLSLMTDVFGNYVIQQLFELGTPAQRAAMVAQMHGHVVALSLQMYGCRVVQMAIKYSPLAQQIKIIQELHQHVVRCIKDHNGNHVIQKSIECIPCDHIQFIFTDLMTATLELAQHTYGCRVVQRVLEYGDLATKEKLLAQLKPHIRRLTEDQYGNYIIQHIVDNGPKRERSLVFEQLTPATVELSSHKYASNVIEKCFVTGESEYRSRMIDKILSLERGSPAIIGMIKDQYANYVVQKILDTAKGDEYTRLITTIRPHLAALKKNSYGKHLASVERLLNVC